MSSRPEPAAPENPPQRAVPTWVILLVVAAVHLALALPALNPAPHTGGDNAGYLSLAHSLAEGQGYVEAWDPAGRPHTKYPPFYPALLAVAMLLGAKAWSTFKLISLLLVTTAVVLSFAWVRERRGVGLAAGVAVVLGFSPALLWSSSWILSDPLFLALTLGCLWAFQRWDDGKRPWIWMAAACVMAILATFTRTAGLPLLLAVAAAFAFGRRWRALAGFALAAAVPSVAWWLRSISAGKAQYVSEFWLVDPYQPDLGTAGVSDLVRRVADNLQGYVFSHIPGAVTVGSERTLTLLGLLLVGTAVAGWARRARGSRTVAEFFFPLYFGLILLWPAVWSGDRFALPLLPLLLFYSAEALWAGAARLHAKGPLIGGMVVIAVLVVPSAGAWGDSVRRATACRAAVRAAGPFACYGEGFQQFVASARWLGENAPDGAAVFTRKPRIFYTLSGLPGRTFPLSPDPGRFFREAGDAGISYVVLDRVDGLAGAYVVPVIRARPDAFCGLVGVGTGQASTQILGIVPEGASPPNPPDAGSGALRSCPAAMIRAEPRTLPSYSASLLPLLALPSP